MDVSICWERNELNPSSHLAKVNLRPYVGTPLERDLSAKDFAESGSFLNTFYAESFCTGNYHITASYDSCPLTSITILVSTPRSIFTSNNTFSRARKVSYKPVLPQGCALHYRECLFSSVDIFASVASITLKSEDQVVGVLFRIELDDGSHLEQFDESPYHVGKGKRQMPFSLEIPFSWPLQRYIQSGRVLSLYRSNLFWLQPKLDSSDLNELLHETNFILVALDRDGDGKEHEDQDFACLMVTRNPKHAFRSTFFSTGTYTAIRIESSSGDLLSLNDLNDVIVCHLSQGTDPFSAIRATIEAHALQRRTFSSRSHKLSSQKWQSLSTNATALTRLGYCTWDAFGHKCSEGFVASALRWLEDKQIPVSYVVIDDGWQDGGSSGPLSEHDRRDKPSPKLSSFHANDKFPNSLRPQSQEENLLVYVWMTVIGYWGGTDGACFERDTIHVTLQPSIGLQRNQPNHTKMWEREYEIMEPTPDNLEDFFTDYFKTLSNHGVACVKIDGQSILGSFTTPDANLSTLVGEYRDALHRAAEHVFPDEVILNSMACAKEVILHSGEDLSVTNICWRTSDDHSFPGVEETDGMVAWHILRNAMNSLFLGEIFPVTDWDMFRVSHKHAHIHAVARVLSGGPVYISDAVPFDEELERGALELIRRLTTSNGRILRCLDPGRPTADCVFGDPRRGVMFKVFNRNAVSGVVGLYNLTTRESGCHIRDDYCSGDVEDFRRGPGNSFISVVVGATWRCAFRHDDCFARQAITLWPMEAAIAHIYPILHFPEDLEIAAIGRLDLLNCGGVVKSVSVWTTGDGQNTAVDVSLADYGTVAVWLGHEAVSRLASVTACGKQQNFKFIKIDDLSFLSVTVPESNVKEDILLRITLENSNASR